MKFIKWKSFFITGGVCLLPIFLGVALWNKLPEEIAIHFDINNNPDNFAPKWFAVFMVPVLMVLLQFFCCFINDINSKKHGERVKFEKITKWIIPIMSNLLQSVTFGFALGWNIDIRKIVAFIVGMILIVIGNYMPKLDYVKNFDTNTEKARKINRFIGYETVLMGAIFLAGIFLPPVATIVGIFLMIPYAVIAVLYSVKVIRQ